MERALNPRNERGGLKGRFGAQLNSQQRTAANERVSIRPIQYWVADGTVRALVPAPARGWLRGLLDYLGDSTLSGPGLSSEAVDESSAALDCIRRRARLISDRQLRRAAAASDTSPSSDIP